MQVSLVLHLKTLQNLDNIQKCKFFYTSHKNQKYNFCVPLTIKQCVNIVFTPQNVVYQFLTQQVKLSPLRG